LVLGGVRLQHVEGVAFLDEVGVRVGDRRLEVVDELRVPLQHERRGSAVRNRLGVLRELLRARSEVEHLVVHQLDRAHRELQGFRDRLHRVDQRVEGVQRERRLLGAADERHLGLDDRSERPLGADEQLREVDHVPAVVVLVDDLVEIVPGDGALEVRVLLVDLGFVLPTSFRVVS